MASYWVLSPAVMQNGVRRPRVATLIDPARMDIPGLDEKGDPIFINKEYKHASHYDENQNIFLSFVRTDDPSNIENDPDCKILANNVERDSPLNDVNKEIQKTVFNVDPVFKTVGNYVS